MKWTVAAFVRVLVAVSLVPLSPLDAQQPSGTRAPAADAGIQHDGPMCVLAGEHARLTACFDSVVAQARLVFRGGGLSNYYRIDMAPDDPKRPCVSGLLPKLKVREARTHQGDLNVQYYIESTKTDLVTARTRLFALQVVDSPSECTGRIADSVPDAEVSPMPVDPQAPPYTQAAAGSHWTAEEASAAAAATPAPKGKGKGGGGAGKWVLPILVGGAVLAAALAVPVGSEDSGSNSGSGGGTCTATNQCSSIGTRYCGTFNGDPQGSSNVRCGSDAACHCCYTVNNRCAITCSSSNPCIDRNTMCVEGVCVFKVGAAF
jgi:hypothetical protein